VDGERWEVDSLIDGRSKRVRKTLAHKLDAQSGFRARFTNRKAATRCGLSTFH
jgi:hypothetical protein